MISNNSAPQQAIELRQMRSGAGRACALMKVLANPDRLMLLCTMAEAEVRVGDLEQQLGITQPTLSQQLTVLREEGLVTTRREGKHIYYRLSSAEALAVMQTLHTQFCSAPQSANDASMREASQ
jgi:DNA-binding transcriptional ArsR family regulator